MEKTCSVCGISKVLDDFHNQPKGRLGRMANCKVCHDARNKAWREANPEKWKAAKAKAQRDYCARVRTKAEDALGGQCSRCGFQDRRVLEIDHINGGGAQEQRAVGSQAIYRKIAAGNTAGYQLLCSNCHTIKTRETGAYGGPTSGILGP